jgi:hypothetical protein
MIKKKAKKTAKKNVIHKHNKKTPPSKSEVGYKKPPLHGRIKKGEVRNPNGYKEPLEMRMLKAVTNTTLATMIQKAITQKPDELKELLKHPDTNAIEAIILGTIIDAVQHRNYNKLEQLLERVIGKVPDKIDMTSKGESINISKEDHAKVAAVVKELNEAY